MSGTTFNQKVAAVVVAAGASKRMPAIKQLLPWKNTSLLGHSIQLLKEAGAAHVFVVLGAYEKKISATLTNENITMISNKNWSDGMGTSIAAVAKYLEKQQLYFDGLLVATCDQPLIPLNHYKKLINSCINNNRIIASSYNNGFGIPVVFDQIYFQELSNLKMDVGAKSVIKNHLDRLILIDAPEAAIDLDTKERYDQYLPTHGISSH